jgi:DNA repair protein RecN (Recombination protein N)
MLLSLEVRDFVIVELAAIEFQSGMTVLTGETGAGKSILIDALGLVLGARSETGMVRAGCDRAEISALFRLPDASTEDSVSPQTLASQDQAYEGDESVENRDAASLGPKAWLEIQGFSIEEDAVLLKRSVDAQGRSRAWINGRTATVQQLRELGAGLLDIHGQHAHQTLLRAATQRNLIDGYGEANALLGRVSSAWKAWQEHEVALEEWAKREESLAQEREELQRERDDLEPVSLTPAGWQELQSEQSRLAHASSLLESSQWGVERLSEGEEDVLSQLHAVSQRLTELEQIDPDLKGVRELIQSAAIAVEEAATDLRRYAHGVDLDPDRLAEVEDQMQRIMACCRRYRLSPDQMHERLLTLRARLEALEGSGSREALIQLRDLAKRDYQALAKELSAARKAAGERLAAVVTRTIQDLAMGDGQFVVQLHPIADGSLYGNEQIEFCLSAFKGQTPSPLAKTASGGELSRISLAIQTALAQVSRTPTLIFDEVDTGIGGRVAEIVGKLLHQVGKRCQVMCVTHLPQVAAWADHHLTVSKESTESSPISRITVLDEDRRVDEVARMLGGVEITTTTLQHARELIDGCRHSALTHAS